MFNDKLLLKTLQNEKQDEFVIRKNVSKEDIETNNGVAVRDDKTNTCALCVALNKTVFHNENKPEYHHPNCKCTNEEFDLQNVTFDFPLEKITNYLFVNVNKKAMMRSMGYVYEDSMMLYGMLQSEIENKFRVGDYRLKGLDIHGQHFEIAMRLYGKRDHTNDRFNCHIGCIAWPRGKIKVATPLIKD